MSQATLPAPVAPPSVGVAEPPRRGRRRRKVLIWVAAVLLIGGVGFYIWRHRSLLTGAKAAAIPTVAVRRGDVSLSISARAELRGGNPEALIAPMTGGGDLHITFLRPTGDLVNSGDIVVQFDTTEQEYKLKEAEADLAEASQHILQAKAQQQADEEEDRYALLKAQTELKLAELDVRKNPLLPAIVGKQNDLALRAAQDHLAQVQQNLANRKATGQASIQMQEAGQAKAQAQAAAAKRNIESMTVKAQRSGYVSVKQNSNLNFAFDGMVLAPFQVGDAVRPGMAVAEIPDLSSWEVAANIDELDRGHIAVGQPVEVTVVALPERQFHGHVKDLGGTVGNFWERHFECTIALDNPSQQLRPGMSARVVISTENLRHALWIPAQALFNSDGRMYVYLKSGGTFVEKDVKLLRRSETRAVVSGLSEGQTVALANPLTSEKKQSSEASPLKNLTR